MKWWVAAMVLLQWNVGVAAELVSVPNDYLTSEIPLGSVVRMKREVALVGGTTETSILETRQVKDSMVVFNTCTLSYLPSAQRRVLPAYLDFFVTNISLINSLNPTPASCWKTNEAQTGKKLKFALKTPNGFNADLTCYEQSAWDDPNKLDCRFNDVNKVGDLGSQILFWADPSKLKQVIGFQ